MAFKFSQRLVADPAAQQNFEQLEAQLESGGASSLSIVRVRRSATYTPTPSAYVGPIPFDVEDVDTDGYWDGTKFQPTREGWYWCEGSIYVDSMSSSPQINLYIVKNATAFPTNGTVEAEDVTNPPGTTYAYLNANGPIYFNGTTDYAEVYVNFQNGRINPSNPGAVKFSAASIGGVKGDKGAPGANGADGADGADGAQGLPGDAPTLYTLDPWHAVGSGGSEPAFASGWTNFGGGLSTLAFRKDPTGRVYLKGQVKSGTAGGLIFTLPVGYRPPERVDIPAFGQIADQTTDFTCAILSDGSVLPPAGAGNTRISFDGMSFDTDTVTEMLAGPKGDPGDTVVDPGAWVDIPLNTATWTGGAQGAGAPRYRKDSSGTVHLDGAATNSVSAFGWGAPSAVVCTLPDGFRPEYPQVVVVYLFNSSGGNSDCTLTVSTNGECRISPGSGPASGATGSQVFFSSLSFLAA